MWFRYGAGRWPWMHTGGADVSGGTPPRGGGSRVGEPAPLPAGPGDGTPVSAWEAVSILLGLTVLSGAMAAVVVTAFVIVIAWLVVTAGEEAIDGTAARHPPQAW
jgi:hypothetical protein